MTLIWIIKFEGKCLLEMRGGEERVHSRNKNVIRVRLRTTFSQVGQLVLTIMELPETKKKY